MTTAIATTSTRSVASFEGAIPTLHLVGRNGMHKYNNQDHAMMTAMLTVQNILAGERALRRMERQRGRRVFARRALSGAKEALESERLVPRKVA